MVSCGADKSIIFRDIGLDKRGLPEFQRGNNVVGKTTLYDMESDVRTVAPSINQSSLSAFFLLLCEALCFERHPLTAFVKSIAQH